MRKYHFLLTGLVALLAFTSAAQTLNGVYVGAQLYTTPFEGMQVNHLTYYFRDDGSFNDRLNTPNWKTNVAGTYTIKQGQVQMTFKNGNEAVRYTLAANGNLQSTVGIKHTLHKVKKVSSLPAATYVRKTASSQGGMGTGMPSIGTASTDQFSIDGKGHFTFDHDGVVGIAGTGMAGTFGNDDKASGSYALGDGEITLTYRSGTVSKVAFFYSPPNEEDLIVLNGDLYFREEGNKTTPVTTNANKAATAADLLSKLRSKYGGAQIDKITTLKETSTIQGGFQLVLYTDLANNKVRSELSRDNKLVAVEQVEGNEGWQWVNGTKKTMPDNDKSEFQAASYLGILGLHKKLNNYFLNGTVVQSGDDQMLTFYIGKVKAVYMVGDDYTLKGNAYSIGETPKIAIYKNFTTKSGILYPGITEFKDGKNAATTITTTAFEINPVLTAATWTAP